MSDYIGSPARKLDNIEAYIKGEGEYFSARNQTAVLSQLKAIRTIVEAAEVLNARGFMHHSENNEAMIDWYECIYCGHDLPHDSDCPVVKLQAALVALDKPLDSAGGG